MKNQNIKGEFVEHIKMENSLENVNKIDKLSKNILLNENTVNAEFIKTNTGLNLNLDYIPQELFLNFRNKKTNQMNANEQINNISFEPKNMQNSNNNDKYDINNNINNIINNELSINENQNLKSKNILESNHFNSLYFNDKSNELKASKKNNIKKLLILIII